LHENLISDQGASAEFLPPSHNGLPQLQRGAGAGSVVWNVQGCEERVHAAVDPLAGARGATAGRPQSPHVPNVNQFHHFRPIHW